MAGTGEKDSKNQRRKRENLESPRRKNAPESTDPPPTKKKGKGKKKISKKKMAPNVVETGVLKTSLDNIVSVGCARLKPRGEGFRGKTCDIMCEDDVFFSTFGDAAV